MNDNDILPVDLPTEERKIIKVIGVGGGGGNAVKNMYQTGIQDVSFVLCNTDNQALAKSSIPVKLQIGRNTTKGLGAGNDPEVARQAAEENIEDIRKQFQDGTEMVFITAGMGGGTGTGAAPVVARIAKESGVLTVGVVTIPFKFELRPKIVQALKGVDAISKHVDALLVINNERIFDIYQNCNVHEAFHRVDDTLTVAVKSISEIITIEGIINLDFRDVSKVLRDGGVAIMSYGLGKGERRLAEAIDNALHSPLLNDNDIYNSKKILFNIYGSTKHPLMVDEMEEINRFTAKFEDNNIEVIWGLATDDSLDEEVKITILATGFGVSNIPGMSNTTIKVDKTPEEKIQETPEEREQREQQEAKDKDMISKYYGGTDLAAKRTIHAFVLEGDDLFNDDLIDALDASPTYQRQKNDLADLAGYRK
ncbi:MAG: cell division protein FtsZ [Bacteroidaceae bacterium]|nr:cell division protein FtsZ [Bacteroidaceae bacterium]